MSFFLFRAFSTFFIRAAIVLPLISCSTNREVPGLNDALQILNNHGGTTHKMPTIVYAPVKYRSLSYYNRLEDILYINSRLWGSETKIRQEMVALHELGHAILKRPHLNELGADGCGTSIMLYNINVECYIKYKDYYLNELFGNKEQFYHN